jgi:hypothetical protein
MKVWNRKKVRKAKIKMKEQNKKNWIIISIVYLHILTKIDKAKSVSDN